MNFHGGLASRQDTQLEVPSTNVNVQKFIHREAQASIPKELL